ncbi:MAG TPA: phosphatase PAP2 family protein [Acidobacteriota bacterium]|nr:phosphatase PAP2 family protein [Acidobacteriota bacterium]
MRVIIKFLFIVLFISSGWSAHAQSTEPPPDKPKEPTRNVRPEVNTKDKGFKDFAKDVGGNLVGLFSRRNLQGLFIGAGATGISSVYDDSIHNYLSKKDTSSFSASLGSQLGEPYVLIPTIFTMFIVGRHTDNTRFTNFSYSLAQGYIVNTIVVNSIKPAVGRERPDKSDNLSFPSGHATDFFMIATNIDQYYGHKAGFISYGAATFFAFARLKKDVHWLSDVFAGATTGFIVGRTTSHRTGGAYQKEHFMSVMPLVNPADKTYAFKMSIHWR